MTIFLSALINTTFYKDIEKYHLLYTYISNLFVQLKSVEFQLKKILSFAIQKKTHISRMVSFILREISNSSLKTIDIFLNTLVFLR